MFKKIGMLLFLIFFCFNCKVFCGNQIASNINWSKVLPFDFKNVKSFDLETNILLEVRSALQTELLNYFKLLLKQQNTSKLQREQLGEIIDYFRWSNFQEGLFYFADYTSKLNEKNIYILSLLKGKSKLYTPIFQHIKNNSKVKFNKNMALLWLNLNGELNNSNEYTELIKETRDLESQICLMILILNDSRATNLLENTLISCSPDTSNMCYKLLKRVKSLPDYVDIAKTPEFNIFFSCFENWYSKKRIKCNP